MAFTRPSRTPMAGIVKITFRLVIPFFPSSFPPMRVCPLPNVFHLCLIIFPHFCLFRLHPPFFWCKMVCRFRHRSSYLFPPQSDSQRVDRFTPETLGSFLLHLCCDFRFPDAGFCFINPLVPYSVPVPDTQKELSAW